MSAVVLVKGTDRVFVVTDYAAYGPDGVVRGFVPKALPITHLRAVVAVRADDAIVLGEASALLAVETYSSLKPEAMRIASKIAHAGHRAEIYIAGFDEDDQSDAFVVTTGDATGASIISATPIDGFAAAPMPPADDPIYQMIGDRNADQIDDRADGLAIIEAQRRNAVDGLHIVGGRASLMSVYRDRIEERILTRWPDKVGERIDPKNG